MARARRGGRELDIHLRSSVLCIVKLFHGHAMKDLERALADITAIRSQLARGTQFRGYGPVTVAATGLLALFVATLQALYLPNPAVAPLRYLAIWSGIASLALAVSAAEMAARWRREHVG